MSNDFTSRERANMYSANRFKIGLFAANSSSGRAVTLVPERWSASWEDNVRLARIADTAGLDFLLPIARWKGYGGETDFQGASLETFTWASGLLASTQRITVFATVHAPLFSPVIAAKACVTADHIGNGRFGLNMVVGWNEGEFEMFGVQQREHEKRYEYGQEWLDAVKLMWSPENDFDFEGKYLNLKGIRLKPKPVGGVRPLIMNAGASGVGRAFAVRNCDAFFIQASRVANEETASNVQAAKDLAKEQGRSLDVYSVGSITCRPSRKEAQDYYHHAIIENADFGSIDGLLALRGVTPQSKGIEEFERQRRFFANGMSGLPLIGDPDDIAEALAQLSATGLTGIGLSFINYLDELPYFCEEVLPRLERLGLREPGRARASIA
ncbi:MULTISPECIES: LLM class flavin-dependent oxidoreductase [unclassified Beijerinckia]|uniref:LLM class flavin-dependent oxidoreductase n=1 Tax=unclassified Beijerinckia TaxID=2638183 RepID=UPI00089C99B3|nr:MULTISPECIES: LLM class flavin-dependent oxidoreductase [unclassified Beijerinckia]MDH7794267.1 FMNH2-dependent dimethyl sulfone monooxygenase [Beijerinckia sp. GAS462]SEB57270.1 Flavin-dependent oxidoreductase, luciferase family (includes alkanesulfonate monooxygenase SsuD and methylene tetrahydromethanopterin reductase) [Beijerinckia sp. 28-YEA-48]